MNFLFLVTGFAFVIIVGLIMSSDRSSINYKRIARLFILQIIIAFLCFNTSGGVEVLNQVSIFFSWLMSQANAGIEFVFGNIMIKKGQSVFFFSVLMPIVFISALIGILNWTKILPFIIKWSGKILSKISGMGELESYFAVSTTVLGQPEVFITVKDQIPKLNEQRLYTICASAMSAVSAAVLASYMKMIPAKYVVVAVLLNILSALIVSSIVNPYEVTEEDNDVDVKDDDKEPEPFFQMLSNYILDGFKMAITVAAMLIGFMSLIAFFNSMFTNIIHISLTQLLGYVFSPIAVVMGVPVNEAAKVGSVMATKLLTNEFVAMGSLNHLHLTTKAYAIIASYCVSFANFGTVGIITGSIKAISEKQGNMVAKFSMKLLIGATLASVLTATIVGFYF